MKVSLKRIVWLHLFPGILILSLYVLITPHITDLGWPSLMSLMISFVVVIVPFEIGHLYRKARKVNKSIKSLLINEPIRRKQFILLLLAGVIVSILISGLGQLIDSEIKTSLFYWLPKWYMYDIEFTQYSRNVLIVTAAVRIFVDGLLIPYAEETYFPWISFTSF